MISGEFSMKGRKGWERGRFTGVRWVYRPRSREEGGSAEGSVTERSGGGGWRGQYFDYELEGFVSRGFDRLQEAVRWVEGKVSGSVRSFEEADRVREEKKEAGNDPL